MEKELKQDATSAGQNGALAADEQLLEYYKPAAQFFRKAWEDLTDDAICTFMEDIEKGHGTFTRVALQLISAFPPLQELAAELSEGERLSLLTDLTCTLTLSVGEEFTRRAELAENKGGRIARKWATGGDLTPEDMKTLTLSAQPWVRYNPDGLGSRAESEEENSAIILEACARLLNEESIPTANSREGLVKLISGWFNSIPSRADNILREHIRKSTAWKRITDQVDSKQTKSEEDRDRGRRAEKAFRVEYQPERDWVLLGEIRALDTLTATERQVIELSLDEDLTQQEIAKKLTISQPRINQLRASAIKKIQRALSL